jgi:hypothetical protein
MYLGSLTAVALLAVVALLNLTMSVAPPHWMWSLLALGPPVVAAPAGVLLLRRLGTEIDAGGIRTVTPFSGLRFSATGQFSAGVEPWSRVVDLRAERRGGRTVVSVYLDSGASVRLRAPYSGELFAADPQFEHKVLLLSHLWRSHRFGGLPG